MPASNLPWDSEAEQALKRVPFFVRAMVRRKVSERVAGRGGDQVTFADFQEAEARFKAVMGGKSEEELKSMVPAENAEGVEMFLIEGCHHDHHHEHPSP